METSTAVLVVGGVAAVGGLGYLYLKSRQQQPSQCGALGSLVGDIAGTFAGPADASANASAQAAAELACNLASKLPVERLGVAAANLPKAIASGPRKIVESPKSFYQTIKLFLSGGPTGCYGRDCCPPGSHSVEDRRASTLALPTTTAAQRKAGVVKSCQADFPEGWVHVPNAPRYAPTPYTQTGNTRDHRTQ